MATYSGFFIIILLASLSAGGNVGSQGVYEGAWDSPRDLPCPNADDIVPCVCTVNDTTSQTTMNCSDVASELQLAAVFSTFLPFPNFFRLIIENNENIMTLRNGALGIATFEEFYLTNGSLQEIQEDALSGSNSRATKMYFSENNINSFPFGQLEQFTTLKELNLNRNQLNVLPPISSSTLEILSINNNPWGSIPAKSFSGAPSLQKIHIVAAGITDIYPGTFSGLPHLREVNLHSNRLTQLHADAIVLNNVYDTFLTINYNGLNSVDPHAISGTYSGIIRINTNELTVIDEAVWRPLLDTNNQLYIYKNPLGCGCEIAWIILNPTYLDLVSYDDPTCYNGELLVDLDPSLYEHC